MIWHIYPREEAKVDYHKMLSDEYDRRKEAYLNDVLPVIHYVRAHIPIRRENTEPEIMLRKFLNTFKGINGAIHPVHRNIIIKARAKNKNSNHWSRDPVHMERRKTATKNGWRSSSGRRMAEFL